MVKYFEDSIVGKCTVYPGEHKVTEEEIIRVAKEWDPQPFHIDKEAAEKSYFGGLVACTTHLFGISSILIFSDPEEWAAVSALGTNNVKNLVPARPGDTLKLRSTCINTRQSESKPGLGIVEYFVELFNQNDDVVFSYTSSALHKLRPA